MGGIDFRWGGNKGIKIWWGGGGVPGGGGGGGGGGGCGGGGGGGGEISNFLTSGGSPPIRLTLYIYIYKRTSPTGFSIQ